MKIILAMFFLFLIFAADAAAQNTSVYTSLKTASCRTIEQSSEEAGWYRGRCKGAGGYALELTEGDLRQTLKVIAPNKKTFQLDFGRVSSGFSSVGEKAEWRMSGKTPVALIARFNVSENSEDSAQTTSYLIVTKITKNSACITDVIKPSKTQNALAQQAADRAAATPCKVFE